MENIRKLFSNLPDRLLGLGAMAGNLWWSWHPAARLLFKMLNRQAWKESGHNPDKMLKEIPKEDLESASEDPDFLRHYDVVLSRFRKEIGKKAATSWNRPLIFPDPSLIVPLNTGSIVPCLSMR
jgi:starch phosphorylase